MLNIILWLLRTGCQWRNLYEGWPNWQAVYYFQQWSKYGTLARINFALNQRGRKQVGKEAFSSLLCIDSQTRRSGVKLNPMIFEQRGTDANKRINAGTPVRSQTTACNRYEGRL